MDRPFDDRRRLEELLQNLVVFEVDRATYRRQLQAIITHVQRSPALWRPATLPDAAYTDGLAQMYHQISCDPRAMPLVGTMDWLNAQLKAAFFRNQAACLD
jgi:hypothetical protein